MKSITNKLNEAIAAMGQELNQYDLVEFETTGITVFGIIANITEDDTYIVKTFGYRGNADRDKIKNEYKIKGKFAKRMWALNMPEEFKEKVKKTLNI